MDIELCDVAIVKLPPPVRSEESVDIYMGSMAALNKCLGGSPFYGRIRFDLDKRVSVGIETYGTPLFTNNGRPATVDAYQEALDLLNYLVQEWLESEGYPEDITKDIEESCRILERLRSRLNKQLRK